MKREFLVFAILVGVAVAQGNQNNFPTGAIPFTGSAPTSCGLTQTFVSSGGVYYWCNAGVPTPIANNTFPTTNTATESTNTVTLTTVSGNWPAAYQPGASIAETGCSVTGYNITAVILTGGAGGTTLTYTDPTGSLGAGSGCTANLGGGSTAVGAITGGVQGATVIGLSGSAGQSSVRQMDATAFCPSSSYSAGKCVTGDMCQAIASAITAAAGYSAEVDARAFYGKQACAAANLTLMLNGLNNGGHVFFGNLHLYFNGPCAATPCTTANTTNFSYNDGSGGGNGAAAGTPALLIPPRVILEGTIPRSDGAYGTVFEVCQGNNNPAGSGCTIGFPQRSYPITTVTCGTGSIANQHTCTVNLTVASGTSCGSAANCAPNAGALGGISTRDCGAANPTFGWIAGATTHSNNFAGTVSACAAAAVTLQAAVDDSVINTSLACAANCGTFYLPTPIVGFMNGDQGTVAYVTSNSSNSVCYGCYIKNISLTATNYEGVVGLEDLFGQERSGADHLAFTQSSWGLVIRGPQTQNGGPFDVGEANAGNFTSCEGHGFAWLQAAGAIRGLRGVTYNAGTAAACNSQAEQSNAMIVWDSQGMNLDTMYLSGGFDGVLVGSQKASHGLNIFNLFCGAGTVATSCQGNAIAYSAAFSPTDVSVLGASVQNATFLNALKNYVTGSGTGADQQIADYFYDNNGAGKIQEISTSEIFPNSSGSGWKENITSLGNQAACSSTFEGVSWVVNNCNAGCTSGTTSCTSGGATHCEMRCNGTSWIQTGR